jgi:carbamoyl-phosphate synthase large subunit
MLPPTGTLLLSIADRDKPAALPLIRRLAARGYGFWATPGTAAMIESLGLPVEVAEKVLAGGHPNVLDVIHERKVDGVVNTVTGGRQVLQDGFEIRRAATERGLPCLTSLDTMRAVVDSLESGGTDWNVLPLREHLAVPAPAR